MRNAEPNIKIPELERQFASLCDQNRDALIGVLRLVVATSTSTDSNPVSNRDALCEIKAKEFVTASEAAELFGCSAQHLRNLVQRAMDGKSAEPIPYRDLDGVITFPLVELIEWTKKPKPKTKAAGRKNKTLLKAIAS